MNNITADHSKSWEERLTSEFLEKETEVFLAPDVGLLVMIGSNLNNEKKKVKTSNMGIENVTVLSL